MSRTISDHSAVHNACATDSITAELDIKTFLTSCGDGIEIALACNFKMYNFN